MNSKHLNNLRRIPDVDFEITRKFHHMQVHLSLVCVCVCVREREREREMKKDSARHSHDIHTQADAHAVM